MAVARSTVDIDDTDLRKALEGVQSALSPEGTRGLLASIGEDLVESAKARFVTGTAPDGSRWLANARSTIERFVSEGGNFDKAGKLNARGVAKVTGKKPLVGHTGMLASQIFYQVESGALVIGSSMPYARVQQQGAKQGEFGRVIATNLKRFRQFDEKDFRRYAGTKKGHPLPWGDIPARPFLGISEADRAGILQVIERRLSGIGK